MINIFAPKSLRLGAISLLLAVICIVGISSYAAAAANPVGFERFRRFELTTWGVWESSAQTS